jgi:hypothetical protein
MRFHKIAQLVGNRFLIAAIARGLFTFTNFSVNVFPAIHQGRRL